MAVIREKDIRRMKQREAELAEKRTAKPKNARKQRRSIVVLRLEEDPGLERQKQTVRDAAAEKEAGKQRWKKKKYISLVQGGAPSLGKRA